MIGIATTVVWAELFQAGNEVATVTEAWVAWIAHPIHDQAAAIGHSIAMTDNKEVHEEATMHQTRLRLEMAAMAVAKKTQTHTDTHTKEMHA